MGSYGEAWRERMLCYDQNGGGWPVFIFLLAWSMVVILLERRV